MIKSWFLAFQKSWETPFKEQKNEEGDIKYNVLIISTFTEGYKEQFD